LIPLFEKLVQHSQKIGARALIVLPTRELALQTQRFVSQLGKYMDLRYCSIVGGDNMEDQFEKLTNNPDM
jgi:ATP-dependent RNA helicase DDX54/DBP10